MYKKRVALVFLMFCCTFLNAGEHEIIEMPRTPINIATDLENFIKNYDADRFASLLSESNQLSLLELQQLQTKSQKITNNLKDKKGKTALFFWASLVAMVYGFSQFLFDGIYAAYDEKYKKTTKYFVDLIGDAVFIQGGATGLVSCENYLNILEKNISQIEKIQNLIDKKLKNQQE